MGKEKDDKNKIEIVSAGAEPGTGGGPVKREESREQQRNEQYNQYVEQVTPKANCLSKHLSQAVVSVQLDRF